MPSVGENMEQLKLSYVENGNDKQKKPWQKCWEIFKKFYINRYIHTFTV